MKDKLLKAGYKEYSANQYTSATKIYQKRFWTEDGKHTKYFITFEEFDYEGYHLGVGYEVDLQFVKTFKGREYTTNIRLFRFSDYDLETGKRDFDNISVEEIEELVDEIWKNNKFNNYE